ncbi:zinc finger protein 277 isoform X2 [Electrophorus electricus]|uniref:zinc finger protein 277 isoform X2 n=1 Tax=Electrophorus electricus TaxID=8005 RepID=UPI0015D016FB|nr:zinc finger protein 277 isoform X2 [Electrophorus electricus]
MATQKEHTGLTGGQECILEPLCFPEHQGASNSLAFPGEGCRVFCVLCSHSLPLSDKDLLLKHLVLEHKLVIADVKLIADFSKYMLYWKKRFTEQPITDFCSVIKTNSEGPAELQENYFLLCDALPEDRILREQLQQKRLEDVLEQQQKERDDTRFQRTCMFCNEVFTGNRSGLLNHMAREHSFSIGLPDNIVYCTEFLDTLEQKLDNLQCLYCEKIFRDKTTLKDHMRKKQHRRLNAKNCDYDRFYVINYLELGKTWEEVQSEDDRELLEEEEDDWSDWQARPLCAVCLFCEQQEETMEKIYTHMQEAHQFDFHKLKTNLCLRFYQQLKLVNYIRRELHHCRCYGCQRTLDTKEEVLQHMMEEGHVMQLPELSHWDQPQYYFPTYENDALLTALSDSESDPEEVARSAEVPVYSEDVSSLRALKQTSVLNTLLK